MSLKFLSIFLSLIILFSLNPLPSADAEKYLEVTQRCENTLLELSVVNQDGITIKNAKIFDRTRSEVLASFDGNGFLSLPADLQGKSLRVGSSSYPPVPFNTEDCQPREIEFEKTDNDLMIVNHHTWSNFDPTANYGDGVYEVTPPTGNYIVGDVVNLSEYSLTDIRIAISTFGEQSGTMESISIHPMKKILRPGEASPFFAYLGGGFDNYSIRIDHYKGTSAMPVIPQVKISDVLISEDVKGNSLLTIICSNTLEKSDHLRLLLLGYTENNFLEAASLTDEYLFSLSDPNASDCIADGKLILSESLISGYSPVPAFVDYAKKDRFEVFIIHSEFSLFYDVQEINRAKNLNAYEQGTEGHTQTAVYSNYFPNSLTPKHIDIDNLKINPQTIDKVTILNSNNDSQNQSHNPTLEIPIWIKTNAEWWSQNKIDDGTFISGIQFLIKEGILNVPATTETAQQPSSEIPSWIKGNAEFWSQGLISDEDFLNGIQYLVQHGIIKV